MQLTPMGVVFMDRDTTPTNAQPIVLVAAAQTELLPGIIAVSVETVWSATLSCN